MKRILQITRISSNSIFRNNLLTSLPVGPHFVAVNNKNEIIVTDFHNHSVKVRQKRYTL